MSKKPIVAILPDDIELKRVNESGLEATEFNCIVKPVEAKKVTDGGVHLPDDHVEREEMASIDCELIHASPLAFTYETWPEDARKPQAGDRVVIAKYAGSLVTGNGNVKYRIIKDKDILAIRSK